MKSKKKYIENKNKRESHNEKNAKPLSLGQREVATTMKHRARDFGRFVHIYLPENFTR